MLLSSNETWYVDCWHLLEKTTEYYMHKVRLSLAL